MPQVNSETIESIQATEKVVKEYVDTDPKQQYYFFCALQKSLHFDDECRVQGFSRHIIHYRRRAVMKLYNENMTFEQIAKSLHIPEPTVRHDVEWYNENKRKNKIPISVNS
jgi:hypothetical protein